MPLGLGFASQVAAGAALVGGVQVTAAAPPHTFAASSDTSRDLSPAGAWTFTAVPIGAAVGPPAAGSLRVGCTTTDAAGIAADTFLGSLQVPYPAANSPDLVPL